MSPRVKNVKQPRALPIKRKAPLGVAHQRIVVPLVWKWNGHLSGPRCVTAYRCERYKAQKEVWCDRIGFYPLVEYRGGGTSYFIDGDKREYKSEKALIAAINKRHNE